MSTIPSSTTQCVQRRDTLCVSIMGARICDTPLLPPRAQACETKTLLEVGLVVQRQQPQELREGLDLLRNALPCPELGQHTHGDAKHGGPAARGTRTKTAPETIRNETTPTALCKKPTLLGHGYLAIPRFARLKHTTITKTPASGMSPLFVLRAGVRVGRMTTSVSRKLCTSKPGAL